MDLSKLYLEKEYNTQEQAAAEGIITSWTKQFDNLNSSLEEERWKCIGRDIQGGYSTLTVSMTERGELKRIFSARKANQQEVKEYEENATAYI